MAAVIGAVLAIVLTSGSGGGGSPSAHSTAVFSKTVTTTAAAPVRHRSQGPARLVFADSGVRLPAARQSPAALTVAAGQVLLAGGLTAAGQPVAGVLRVTPTEAAQAGRLPRPLSEAAAASVSGTAYVFGGSAGGGGTSAAGGAGATGSAGAAGNGAGGAPTSDIVRIDPAGTAQTVGHLPAPAAGAGAAAIGANAYIVGGYDGSHYLTSIVAWQPGVGAHIVATLPVGLRDPAVAAISGQLVIAGGTTPKGPSRALYGYDPSGTQVVGIGPLPGPLTHAQAVVLNGRVFVLGGETSVQGTQTDAILEYDPVNARVSPAGRLPTPLSDAGAATIEGQVVLAGGIDDSGRVHDEVFLGSLSG
jgi:N-acetylneuraminic acid mutarotase